MPIIEGLDNTGKNTYVTKNYGNKNVKIHEFPNRTGLHGDKICKFLAGEIEYTSEVETWFLENRLEYYSKKNLSGDNIISPGDVIIRSGISFLVYKWYRSGKEPSEEDYIREAKLINGEEIIYLNSVFDCPSEKKEIYDRITTEQQIILDKLFQIVISKISSVHY